MKFLLLVIGLIMHTICIVHAYLELISLPLSYLNFVTFYFLCSCGLWVFIQQFRHMWTAGIINFRTVGDKLAIPAIFLVDLEAHFFRNMFSCSWSSEQHLALCLQCVSLLLVVLLFIRPEFFSQRFP